MEGTPNFTALHPGDDVIATADHESFAYFSLSVMDNTEMLTIRADPADEKSDPDIYVSNFSPEVS